ncbi:MAG: STAS domain-containing protein [Candidatus Hydrogenedentes bacterium]|nr:STAS domain-containing protein [Candidatus Hydrogenedentota bacterium]
MDAGKILYAKHEGLYTLKFVGRIGYTSNWAFPLSKSLQLFIDQMAREKDYEYVLIDLSEATGIDSTNLGLLAEIAKMMIRKFDSKATIISTNRTVTRTLKTVGFNALFTIVDRPADFDAPMLELPPVPDSEMNVARMILKAHKTLCELNDDNQLRFQNIVDALESEIIRKEAARKAVLERGRNLPTD